jgi:hypothetical protein
MEFGLQISNIEWQALRDTAQMAENMAGMMNMSPADIRRSPIFLIGTSEECVTELQRRARAWELSEIVFSWSLGEAGMRKLAKEVLPYV